jgi:hypothetical protein
MCKRDDCLAAFILPPTPPRSPVTRAAVVAAAAAATHADLKNAGGHDHHDAPRRSPRAKFRPRHHTAHVSSSPMPGPPSPISSFEAEAALLPAPVVWRKSLEKRRTKSWQHHAPTCNRHPVALDEETSLPFAPGSPDELLRPLSTPSRTGQGLSNLGLEPAPAFAPGVATENLRGLLGGREGQNASRSVPSPCVMVPGAGDTAAEDEDEAISAAALGRLNPRLNGTDGLGSTKGELQQLPRGTRVKGFVGEGSANVVVRIELPEDTSVAIKKFFQGQTKFRISDAEGYMYVLTSDRQAFAAPEGFR